MKMWKKILTSALAAVMIFSLSAEPVLASQPADSTLPNPTGTIETGIKRDKETTYKITLHAGNGEFKDEETVRDNITGVTLNDDNFGYSNGKIVISNLKAADIVNIAAAIDITNAKKGETTTINGVEVLGETYYVKGFARSGQGSENFSPALNNISPKAIGDVDYVVVYGIEGNQVSYTVKYQDTKGNTLAKDDIFYGNVGDKPVVAYKYIEGYAPTVFAYTKTLSENTAENVFIFVYDKVPTQSTKEVVTEETEYNYVTVGGETIIVNGGGTASNVTGGGAGAGGDADANAEDAAGAGEETVIPGIDESEIVDLDDEETPLANVEVDGDSAEDSSSSVGVYTALGLLAVIIVAIVAYIVSKKKKIQE